MRVTRRSLLSMREHLHPAPARAQAAVPSQLRNGNTTFKKESKTSGSVFETSDLS